VKIAVLGSLGLIGSALAGRLRREHEVVGIDRGTPADFTADLTDPASLARLDLRGFEVLVHAAGVVDEDFAADPGRAFVQSTRGMSDVVAMAARAGIGRFCYLSSAHVYGPLRGRIDEASTPNPTTDYATAHFASEQILRRSMSEDLLALVLRPCAVFGIPPDFSRFRRWSLIPFGFPRSAVTRQSIELRSSGMQMRNFVGTADVAECVADWLSDRRPPGFRSLNPVGTSTLTVLDFARLCAKQYQQLTGTACRVVAPVAEGAAEDLVFASLHAQPAHRADLAATIRELTMLLLKRGGGTDRP